MKLLPNKPVKTGILLFFCFTILISIGVSAQSIDTVYAGSAIRVDLIKSTHNRYIMLIKSKNEYKSIKFLERNISVSAAKIVVVQKLMNGTYTNTDSVIINKKTLVPLESYSDINTAKDSFMYKNGRIGGSVTPKVGTKYQKPIVTDTAFSKPMFNGLIYAETFQSLSYEKNKPFYIAEYVPGHQTKYTKVEYVNDESLDFSGTKILTKVIKAQSAAGSIYYWLGKADQQLIKIEARFPAFEYFLLKTV